MLSPGGVPAERSEAERGVLALLQAAPHTLYHLQTRTEARNLLSVLETLISDRVVTRIGLTPTDLLHASGGYDEWSRPGAEAAVRILADQLGVSLEQCLRDGSGAVRGALSHACINSGFSYDSEGSGIDTSSAADYLIRHIFLENGGSLLQGTLRLKKPLVMIGAPARAWGGRLSEILGTEVVIPHCSDVANAVGAAVAQTVDRHEILIRQDPVSGRFTAFSAETRRSFDRLEEATEYARASGRRLALANLPGCPAVHDSIDDLHVTDRVSGAQRFVERRVTVTACREPARPSPEEGNA